MNPRHIACKLCRDRKVRCPGEQPACARCRRAGEQCIYLAAQRPTKANLNETVEALQKRLIENETLILKLSGAGTAGNVAAMLGSCASGFDWPTGSSGFSSPAPPCLFDPPGSFFGSPGSHQGQDLVCQQPNLHSSELPPSSEPSATQSGLSGAGGRATFQAGEPMDFDKSPLELCLQLGLPLGQGGHELGQGPLVAAPQTCNGSTSSPSGIESTSTLTASSAAYEPPETTELSGAGRSKTAAVSDSDSEGPAGAGAAAAVVDALAAYCSSVVRRECEVAGLATAVADYIAWVRGVPAAGAPPVTNAVYQQMLANIETRVRELVELAKRRHDEPLRDLLRALEGASPPDLASRVAGLEARLERQMREHTRFFETEYTACKPLSEQARKRP